MKNNPNSPEDKNMHLSNKKAWDEASVEYETGLGQAIEFLKKGGQNFCPPELPYLKDLASWCHRAIHLQCAGGTDTLSLYNRGAREVVGVDISEKMISVAKRKAQALEIASAHFYCCDILELPQDQKFNHSFDLVYTGRGAINWIMDIKAWAKLVFRLLKKGGFLYLFEGHPLTLMFPLEAKSLTADPNYKGYFHHGPIEDEGWPESYITQQDKLPEQPTPKFEKAWPVSAVINALIEEGLVIRKFEEYPDAYWEEFPLMPEELRRKFPNTYSLLAQVPLPF